MRYLNAILPHPSTVTQITARHCIAEGDPDKFQPLQNNYLPVMIYVAEGDPENLWPYPSPVKQSSARHYISEGDPDKL